MLVGESAVYEKISGMFNRLLFACRVRRRAHCPANS